jgi:hypothetical protein
MADHRFTAELWRHPGESAWHFVTLPRDVADDVEERSGPAGPGFGSVRVEVTCGHTTWRTSLFPATKAQSYLLPVKKAVRLAEGLDEGDAVDVSVCLVDT